MGEIIALILIAAAIIVFLVRLFVPKTGAGSTEDTTASRPAVQTIQCPNCGSPAEVHGSSWECGWCGDFGQVR